MIQSSGLEEERLQQLALEYRSRGYRVMVRPRPNDVGLPADFKADLVAISPEDRVVVEVKSRQSLRTSQDLRHMAAQLEDMGWRLELVVANPLFREDEIETLHPSKRVIARRANEAQDLARESHLEAGLLLAWSALEGAIRQREGTGRFRSRVALKELYSEGVLSDRQYELVERAAAARSAIAHGSESPIDRTLVERLARLAEKLADPEYPSVSDMVEWFFENYEDPAQGVPHDSGEGGYQYVAGGPYNAREELSEHFPNVDQEDLDEAVQSIEAEGYEWVRKGQY